MRADSPILRSLSGKGYVLLLVAVVSLSAYTHTWNPAGFPILQGDESVYVKRGVDVLDGEILYGLYDHPFFGQTVLAGFMYVSGYPDLLDDPPADRQADPGIPKRT